MRMFYIKWQENSLEVLIYEGKLFQVGQMVFRYKG